MKHKHILFGLLALMVASCTNDEMNEVAEMKQNGIQVTADFGADTRIDFSEEANVTHVFWNEGDQITIYDEAQGGLDYQVASVSNGGATANFSAINAGLQETAEGATVNAIYPALPVEDGIVKLPNTNVWNEDRLIPYATASGSISDSKLGLSFFHQFAYLKLTLNAETVANSDAQTIHAVYLTTTQDPAPLSLVNGTYDIINNSVSYQDAEGDNSIHFSLNEPFTATGDAEKVIYIPILPQSAGETLTLSILHHDDYGVCDTLLTVSKQVPESGFTYGNVYTYTPKQSFTREGNTITLTEAGTLSQAISEEEKYSIKELKIVGPLNGDDILFIREMAGVDVNGNATEGVLTNLDISEATIVEGGEYYYVGYLGNGIFTCYTSNDMVGMNMFGRTILQQVLLPNGVTSIDHYAFYGCSSLTSINIPDGVTEIGNYALSGCSSLVKVYISDLSAWCRIVFGISSYPLSNGGKLYLNNVEVTELVIPNDITEIKNNAFYGYSFLTSITIPDGITSIGYEAFENCSSLVSVAIGNGVTSIGGGAFAWCSELTSINIPDGVTSIGNRAFQECSSLTSINIPDGVTEIGSDAFYGCSSLSEVSCNAMTPPTLGLDAFANIASSAILYIPTGTYDAYMASDWANYFTTIDDGESHIGYANGVVTLQTAGSLSSFIPEDEKYTITSLKVVGPLNGNDIRFIREMAGRDIDNQVTEGALVDLDLNEAIITRGGDYYYNDTSFSTASYNYVQHDNTIGNWMFTGLNLKNIILPSSVTEISYHAFESCSLVTLTIPDSVTTIADFAFCSNRWLTTVTIGAGVTSIGRSCFYYSTSLAEVTCNATTPPTLDETGVFSNIAESATLYVPTGCKAAYSSSSWADWFTTIEEK